MKLESGIFDKSRLVANILMIVLIISNVFFSAQYISGLQQQASQQSQKDQEDAKVAKRIQVSRFLKYFIDVVLNANSVVSFDDRVKLENDLRQIGDPDLTNLWDKFVGSKDSKSAQENAVKLMKVLSVKML